MYAASLIGFIATQLALGSAWTLIVVIPLGAVLIIRLPDEERYLMEALPGYKDSPKRVRYRLFPGVW